MLSCDPALQKYNKEPFSDYCGWCAESVPPAEGQGTQLPYVSAPAWGAWVPAIQQMVGRLHCGIGSPAQVPATCIA